MKYETLIYENLGGGVGKLTLNRPTRANAMNQFMLSELEDACTKLACDDELKCLIVTGEGAAFSSGFDLKDQADNMPVGVGEWTPVLEADFRGIMSFWEFPKVTIAAVNGPALAGGFEMMLGCDISIASENAVFGEPELKFGAGIVAMLLPWFVGPKVAKEIIFTGEDQITASRALELGLINQIVPEDQVMDVSISFARKMAKMDQMVLKRTKMAVNRTYEIMGMQRALRSSLDIDIMIEGEGSDLKREFLEVVREQGLGSALKWRAAKFE